MKYKGLLLVLILALLLCGCAAPKTFDQAPEVTQYSPMEVTDVPPADDVFTLPDGYDPGSEEDTGAVYDEGVYNASGESVYAGATPIPIDPVDMPTATPRPELAFTYALYSATKLGYSFEAPAGYLVDESRENAYVLTEPIEQQKDNYSAQLTLTLSPVAASYKYTDIRTDLKDYLSSLGAVNYKTWEVKVSAERTLLKSKGYYNDYRGVMEDGTIVRGRVHMVLLDNNTLLTLHVTCPGWYNTDFMNVYAQIRNTIKKL